MMTKVMPICCKNGIHAVVAVTIRPEDYEKAKEVMLFITRSLAGILWRYSGFYASCGSKKELTVLICLCDLKAKRLDFGKIFVNSRADISVFF